MNVNELLNVVREYVDEPSADAADYSDANLLVMMNLEHKHLISAYRQRYEDWLGREFVFLTVLNQARNYLPMDAVEIRRIEFIDGNNVVTGSAPNFVVDEVNAQFSDITPIELNSKDGVIYLNTNSRFRSLEGCYLYADEIRWSPGTTLGNGRYCRVFYTPTSIDLHRATAAAGAANTITLGVNGATTTLGSIRLIDNYYQWARIEIISGTGLGQARRITQYNGTTRVATVDSNWGTNPNGTSVYSIVSPIVEDFHELIPLGGAIRAKGIKTEDDTSDMTTMYGALMADFKSGLERRLLQTSRRVQNTTRYGTWN